MNGARTMHLGEARAMLAGLAFALAVIAYGFGAYNENGGPTYLWPAVFVAAAVSCLAMALAVNRLTLRVSGLLVFMAPAARAGGVFVDYSAGHRSAGELLVGLALYAIIAVLAATVWVFVLGPITSWTLQHRGSRPGAG